MLDSSIRATDSRTWKYILFRWKPWRFICVFSARFHSSYGLLASLSQILILQPAPYKSYSLELHQTYSPQLLHEELLHD